MMNTIKNQIVRGRMKKLILFLCATLSALVTPGSTAAAHKSPDQTSQNIHVQEQPERVYTAASYDSFIALLTSYATKIQNANRRVPSLALAIADIHTLCNELARILFHISTENSLDQIKFLHRELLGVLGDFHLPQKSISPAQVRHARMVIEDWAYHITQKIIKSRKKLKNAAIDPKHAANVLKSLRIKLTQRIMNPAFVLYKTNAEKMYDHYVAKPLEWVAAHPHIVIPATLISGFLAWTARDQIHTLGLSLYDMMQSVNETRISVRQQPFLVDRCGYETAFNALELAKHPKEFKSRKELPPALTQEAPFTEFYERAKTQISALNAPTIATYEAKRLELDAELATATTYAYELALVRQELKQRLVEQHQASVHEDERNILPELIEAKLTNISRDASRRDDDAILTVEDLRAIMQQTPSETLNDIIASAGCDALKQINPIWPQNERIAFWSAIAREEHKSNVAARQAVFGLVRNCRTEHNIQKDIAVNTALIRNAARSNNGTWIEANEFQHLINTSGIATSLQKKIVTFNLGPDGSTPIPPVDHAVDICWNNDIQELNEQGHILEKIVRFQKADPANAHLVVAATTGTHWITVNCTKRPDGSIVAQMADSLGRHDEIRIRVLEVLNNTAAGQCWDRIQAARNPGHAASVVGS